MSYEVAQFYGDHPMHHMMGGYGGWYSLASFILFMLVIIAMAALAYRLIYAKHITTGGNNTDPLEAAKLRYAKGEITEEEFARIKKNLSE